MINGEVVEYAPLGVLIIAYTFFAKFAGLALTPPAVHLERVWVEGDRTSGGELGGAARVHAAYIHAGGSDGGERDALG